MLVSIFRDGKVFFRNDWTNPAELPASIREYLSSGSEKRVYVKADGRVHYGTVVEVLDGVRSAGIEQVGFLVEQRRGDDAPSH